MSSALLARDTAPTEEDIKLKAALQAEYVKELWWFLGALIGLLTIVNWASRLLRLTFNPKRPSDPRLSVPSSDSIEHGSIEQKSFEALPHGRRTGRLSIRRLPAALAGVFQNLAFRTTVSIGPSSVMSVTEATFILAYVIALLVWLFISSKCS